MEYSGFNIAVSVFMVVSILMTATIGTYNSAIKSIENPSKTVFLETQEEIEEFNKDFFKYEGLKSSKEVEELLDFCINYANENESSRYIPTVCLPSPINNDFGFSTDTRISKYSMMSEGTYTERLEEVKEDLKKDTKYNVVLEDDDRNIVNEIIIFPDSEEDTYLVFASSNYKFYDDNENEGTLKGGNDKKYIISLLNRVIFKASEYKNEKNVNLPKIILQNKNDKKAIITVEYNKNLDNYIKDVRELIEELGESEYYNYDGTKDKSNSIYELTIIKY